MRTSVLAIRDHGRLESRVGGHIVLVSVGLALAMLTGLGAAGAQPSPQDPQGRGAPDDEARSLEVDGHVDLGFRWRDASGNEAKYREDLNYATGPRVFNLDLSLVPAADSAVDRVEVFASGLGDPYEALGVTIRRFDRFQFRFRRHRSAYFYRDTVLPSELADLTRSNGGDFHHFDTERTNDRFDLDLALGRRSKVVVAFNRQLRAGESTTTADISRDEFELDRPLHEVKNDYTVGFQVATPRISLWLDQTYRDYESDGRIFLPGASPGENVEDTAELFFYEQLLPFDFTMPQSTVKVHVRPGPRLSISGGVVYSDLTGDFSHAEDTRGISFQGTPLETRVSGDGRLERQTVVADVDVVYDLAARLAVTGGVRFADLDQDGDLATGAERLSTGVGVSTGIVEVGAQTFAGGGVTVAGGLRFEQRETTVDHADATDDRVETDRTTVFVSGTIRPSPRLHLFGEYERGTYDNPLTLIAPTRMDRIKARVRLRPAAPLTVTGVVHLRRLENDLAGPTLGPGVQRASSGPAAVAAALETTDVTAHAAYDAGPAALFGSYTRREVGNEVVNLVTTAPGFQGGQTFVLAALYQSDLDRVAGGARVTLSELMTLGTELAVNRNRGSFGLDWNQYRVYAELRAASGALLRATYQFNRLDEVDFDFDDYRSHIVTLSVGHQF